MANLQISPPPGFIVINEPERKKDNPPPGFVLVDKKPIGIQDPTVPLPPAGWKPQEQPQRQPQQAQPEQSFGSRLSQNVWAIPEAGMAAVSGVGSIAIGLVAQAGKTLFDVWKTGGKEMPFAENKKIKEWVQSVGGYQPKTPGGQALIRVASLPFEGLLTAARLGVNKLTDDIDAQEGLMLAIEGAMLLALPKLSGKAKAIVKRTVRGRKSMPVKDVIEIINQSKEVPIKIKAELHKHVRRIEDAKRQPPKVKRGETEVYYVKDFAGKDVEVIRNPTPRMVEAVEKEFQRETRGKKAYEGENAIREFTTRGNRYIWRADQAIHDNVLKGLEEGAYKPLPIKDVMGTPTRVKGKEIPGQRELRIQKELKKRGIGVRKEGDIRPVSEAGISAFQKAGGEVEVGRAPARTAAERQAVMERLSKEGMEPGAIKGGGLPYGAELPTRVGNIRIDKLRSSYDIKKTLVEIADVITSKQALAGKRKVPWKEVEADAARIGMTVESLKKARKNKAYNAAELEALRTMEGAAIRDLFNKQQEYAKNPSDFGLVELNASMERALMITESYSGAATTAGRALNILRKEFKPGELKFKAMEKALRDLGGREKNQRLVEMMQKLDWNNNLEVINFIRNMQKAKLSDKVFEVWVNGLLSGPQTHVVNTVSNAIMLADKVAMTGVAALIEAPKALVGKQRSVYLGEVPAQIFGILRGLPEGVRKGLYAWKNEITMGGVSKLEMRIPQAIKGKKGKVVRIPGRGLIAFDELFKSMLYSADIHSMAYKIATRAKLKGKAKATEVARLITNPSKVMMDRATGEMLRGTFQQELGKTGKAIQTFRTSIPGVRYIIPFLRVSINIPKAGLKRTPLNIPRIIWLASKGKLTGEALSIEIARAGVGSLTAMVIYDMATKGQITGAAPTEIAERDAFYAEGKQPYSIKVGDKYYSYGRLEPVSTVFGIAADAYQVFDRTKKDEKNKIASSLIKAVTENLTNKTFMRGVSTAMNAVSDPERSGQYFIESLAGTAVPTGVAQVAKAVDPTLRETQTIIEHIKSRIPGISKQLPPKVDRRGKEVVREGGFAANLLSPVWVSTDVTDDIDRELRRLEIFPGRMGKQTVRKGEKIPPMPYARMLKEAGPRVFTALGNLLRSEGYPNLSDTQKKKLITGIISTIKGTSRFQYRYKDYKK